MLLGTSHGCGVQHPLTKSRDRPLPLFKTPKTLLDPLGGGYSRCLLSTPLSVEAEEAHYSPLQLARRRIICRGRSTRLHSRPPPLRHQCDAVFKGAISHPLYLPIIEMRHHRGRRLVTRQSPPGKDQRRSGGPAQLPARRSRVAPRTEAVELILRRLAPPCPPTHRRFSLLGVLSARAATVHQRRPTAMCPAATNILAARGRAAAVQLHCSSSSSSFFLQPLSPMRSRLFLTAARTTVAPPPLGTAVLAGTGAAACDIK